MRAASLNVKAESLYTVLVSISTLILNYRVFIDIQRKVQSVIPRRRFRMEFDARQSKFYTT